jgi:hypothetical protein
MEKDRNCVQSAGSCAAERFVITQQAEQHLAGQPQSDLYRGQLMRSAQRLGSASRLVRQVAARLPASSAYPARMSAYLVYPGGHTRQLHPGEPVSLGRADIAALGAGGGAALVLQCSRLQAEALLVRDGDDGPFVRLCSLSNSNLREARRQLHADTQTRATHTDTHTHTQQHEQHQAPC